MRAQTELIKSIKSTDRMTCDKPSQFVFVTYLQKQMIRTISNMNCVRSRYYMQALFTQCNRYIDTIADRD